MKKFISMLLITTTLFTMAGCSTSNNTTGGTDPDSKIENPENVQIPSPFIEFNNISEAEKFAGFKIVVKEIDGYPIQLIQAVKDEMIQIMFLNKATIEEGAQVINIRKSNQVSEDISGDHNNYERTETVKVGDIEVTIKGNGNKASVAAWTNDGFSYSITSDEELSIEMMTNLVQNIK